MLQVCYTLVKPKDWLLLTGGTCWFFYIKNWALGIFKKIFNLIWDLQIMSNSKRNALIIRETAVKHKKI